MVPVMVLGMVAMGGCQTAPVNTNEAARSSVEATWIREGQPIEFEGERWYPLDADDNLLDSEVYIVGRYQEVEFFVDRVDVRPYNRRYTKFGRNKYRAFEKKSKDDQGK